LVVACAPDHKKAVAHNAMLMARKLDIKRWLETRFARASDIKTSPAAMTMAPQCIEIEKSMQ
jgi:hypothetical protein